MPKKFENGIDAVNNKLINLGDPSSATDAVNLQTLQNYIRGITSIKDAVRVATTTSGTLASDFENGDTIDGVALVTGDRILIKNQVAGATNGIYTVNASGAPTRAVDADTSVEVLAGMTMFVSEGTVNGNTTWQLTTDNPIVLGTTALVFAQIGAATIYTASNGLVLVGNDFRLDSSSAGNGLGFSSGVLSVNVSTGLEINTDNVRLAAQGNGISGGAGTTLSVNPASGGGVSVAAGGVSVDSTVARVFTTSTHSSSATIAVTHSLGKQWVTTAIYITSTGEQIECDVVATSTTVTTFIFNGTQLSNTLTFVIVG